jgi:chromosome partitioning protein
MKIISVINQKGGVGKTTTVQNLGIGLAAKGFKVGLVDMDEQVGNLTFSFFNNNGNFKVTLPQILKAIVVDKEEIKLDPLHFTSTNFDNLSILPTNDAIEVYLNKAVINPSGMLKKILPTKGFDYILIDTPPSMTLPTFNALAVSDYVLLLSQPEILSLAGIVKITNGIEEIKTKLNPKLKILGVVLNMVRANTKITKDALNWLRTTPQLSNLLFDTQIPHTQEVGNTQSDILGGILKTIFQKKSSNIGMYYSELVNEFIKKTTSK